jgi:hypothetical protein
MALGSTHPLTGVVSGGKGGRCVRLTTLPPSCTAVMKYGNLNFLEPSGPLQACNGTALPFFCIPQQAEVALGVPGRLRPRNISTFGTRRVVGRQPNPPAAFTPACSCLLSLREAATG